MSKSWADGININKYEADSVRLRNRLRTFKDVADSHSVFDKLPPMILTDIDLHSAFQLANNSTISLHSNEPSQKVHKENFPSQDEELVRWAEEKFGGVTSFTTLRKLGDIKSTGMTGEKCCHHLSRAIHVRWANVKELLWITAETLEDCLAALKGFRFITLVTHDVYLESTICIFVWFEKGFFFGAEESKAITVGKTCISSLYNSTVSLQYSYRGWMQSCPQSSW